MTKNIQWKKSTIDYSALDNIDHQKIVATETGLNIGSKNIEKWKIENPELAKKQSNKNGKKQGDINAETGHMKKIQKIGASLGGSANTKKQKEARKIQNKKHYQKAGTIAAAEAATIAMNKNRVNVCSNLELKKWYTIKEIELIVKSLDIKRFSVRSMCESELFESQKKGITNFYKLKQNPSL